MRTKFFSMVLIFCLLFSSCAESAMNAAELKKEFMLFYNSEWKLSNFNYELFRIINGEFDTITDAMLYGTRGFQLAVNKNNLIGEILSDIFSKFQPDYELFFKVFYDKYYAILDKEPEKYSREKIKSLLCYEEVASLQPEIWHKKLIEVNFMFRERLSVPYFTILILAAGFLLIIFSGFLTKILDIGHSERRRKFFINTAGVVIIILGTLQVSRWFFFAQGAARDFVYEQTKILYTSELPEAFWKFIEPHVIASIN